MTKSSQTVGMQTGLQTLTSVASNPSLTTAETHSKLTWASAKAVLSPFYVYGSYIVFFLTGIATVINILNTIELDASKNNKGTVKMEGDTEVRMYQKAWHKKEEEDHIFNVSNVQCKILQGQMNTGIQSKILSVGVQEQDLDMNDHNLISVNQLEATTMATTLLTAQQPGITGLGPLSAALNMGNNKIENAASVTAEKISGTLTADASLQTAVTGIGPLSADLDLGQYTLTGVKQFSCTELTVTGELKLPTITEVGPQSRALVFSTTNTGQNKDLINMSVLRVSQPQYAVYSLASIASNAQTYALTFANTSSNTNTTGHFVKITNAARGDALRIITPGLYAICFRRIGLINDKVSVALILDDESGTTETVLIQDQLNKALKFWIGPESHVIKNVLGNGLDNVFWPAPGGMTWIGYLEASTQLISGDYIKVVKFLANSAAVSNKTTLSSTAGADVIVEVTFLG